MRAEFDGTPSCVAHTISCLEFLFLVVHDLSLLGMVPARQDGVPTAIRRPASQHRTSAWWILQNTGDGIESTKGLKTELANSDRAAQIGFRP
jgi:hypothetical protein